MKYFLISFLLSILILSTSCARKKYECPYERLEGHFIGYHKSQVDSIMVYRFKQDTDFNELVDSMQISASGLYSPANIDTFKVSLENFNYLGKNAGYEIYDLRIINLYDSKMFEVTEIGYHVKTYKGEYVDLGSQIVHCNSSVSRFVQDGNIRRTGIGHAFFMK